MLYYDITEDGKTMLVAVPEDTEDQWWDAVLTEDKEEPENADVRDDRDSA